MTQCPFKKYKHALGMPDKGVHKYKILNTAIIDYVLTIFLAIVITTVTKIPLVLTTIVAFISSIVLHTLFGLETNSVKYLNLTCGE